MIKNRLKVNSQNENRNRINIVLVIINIIIITIFEKHQWSWKLRFCTIKKTLSLFDKALNHETESTYNESFECAKLEANQNQNGVFSFSQCAKYLHGVTTSAATSPNYWSLALSLGVRMLHCCKIIIHLKF